MTYVLNLQRLSSEALDDAGVRGDQLCPSTPSVHCSSSPSTVSVTLCP
jgi:hypothetical protein